MSQPHNPMHTRSAQRSLIFYGWFVVLAAALAPLPLAAWQQAAGSYAPGLAAMVALPLGCALLLLRFRPPRITEEVIA